MLLNSSVLDVIFEDNHLIAINKKSGTLVQGDKTGDDSLVDLVKAYLKAKYNKSGKVFCGCIHRLDRPVSGVVLFARTSKALERMNKAFQKREVEKYYYALVKGVPSPKEGELIHYLKKDPKKNITSFSGQETRGSTKAMLNYKLIYSADGLSLLKIRPKTGRPHQIRAQMSAISCPIKGDLKYGDVEPNRNKSINLHSYRLGFFHPVKNEWVIIEAFPPIHSGWQVFAGFFDK